jgi:hypothetical protein
VVEAGVNALDPAGRHVGFDRVERASGRGGAVVGARGDGGSRLHQPGEFLRGQHPVAVAPQRPALLQRLADAQLRQRQGGRKRDGCATSDALVRGGPAPPVDEAAQQAAQPQRALPVVEQADIAALVGIKGDLGLHEPASGCAHGTRAGRCKRRPARRARPQTPRSRRGHPGGPPGRHRAGLAPRRERRQEEPPMHRRMNRDQRRQDVPGPLVEGELVQTEPVHEQPGQEHDDCRTEQHHIEDVSQVSARHPGASLIHHAPPRDQRDLTADEHKTTSPHHAHPG